MIKSSAQFTIDWLESETNKLDGLYKVSTKEQYFGVDAVSQSSLKSYEENPRKYRYELRHGRKKSTAADQGNLLDDLILSRDGLDLAIAPKSASDKRRKPWKEWAESHKGQTLLKLTEFQEYARMRRAVISAPEFHSKILKINPNFTQVAIFWTVEGVLRKGLIDYLDPSLKFAMDLKKMKDVSLSGWEKANKAFRHYNQAAWYMQGLQHFIPTVQNFYFCTVEGTPPFDSVWRALTDGDNAIGLHQLEEILPSFIKSKETGFYPSNYPTTVQVNPLPNWSMHIDERGEYA